jgi:hypothetical protein
MQNLETFLTGSVVMASVTVSLFFMRFWLRTRDSLFVWFSIAFAVEALNRCVLTFRVSPNEDEPLFYLPRLFAFGLIALAVFLKNRPQKRR